ncbi:MAG: hypothetical protein OEW78_07555 [Nitrosopumilus sp.]|uniref:hypothetical protein n=1 Tax=Nitrosopumilus sp. TaxID=2024843 RepID=UPI00246B36FA|nr:hypothetical protein [Nitrosopumilus sp.]MDH5431718.1 hypothetical protein [Nitrosopumilus sp.]
MKDTIDSIVNDVKLYSKGLVNALENNHDSEAMDYVQNMKNCLKIVNEYLEMKKDIKS